MRPVTHAYVHAELVCATDGEVSPQLARVSWRWFPTHGIGGDQDEVGQGMRALKDVGKPEVGADEDQQASTADGEFAQGIAAAYRSTFLGVRSELFVFDQRLP